MTKLVICGAVGSIHFLSLGTGWRKCECGNTAARWIDPDMGTVAVAARLPSAVRILGMNNQMLVRAMAMESAGWSDSEAWENYRKYHDIATDARGFVFDKTKADCWAVVCKVASTGDTRWASGEERAALWPEVYPD